MKDLFDLIVAKTECVNCLSYSLKINILHLPLLRTEDYNQPEDKIKIR